MSAKIQQMIEQISSIKQELASEIADDEGDVFLTDENATTESLRALEDELYDIINLVHPENADASGATDETDTLASGGLAVMVGHTRLAQGYGGIVPPFASDDPATPASENHEYGWNGDLARRMKAFADANGIRCEIFWRDGRTVERSYDAVRQWAPTATVELHFNAVGRPGREHLVKGSLALYGGESSRAWAQVLQDAMVDVYDRQGRQENHGIHVPGPNNGYRRGRANVTQIQPSALIEPFFGRNPRDAKRGIDRKQALAESLVAAYAKFAGTVLTTQPASPSLPASPASPASDTAVPDVPLFRELWTTYQHMSLAIPDLESEVAQRLKAVTLAQWIEESGWARSGLAQQHRNFAGMKAIAEVDKIIRDAPASKVAYDAHDGRGVYLRFASINDFIRGYWMFLDRSPYAGWRRMAQRSPSDFIRFIGRKWAQKPGYADRVLVIVQALVNQGIANADGTLRPAVDSGPATPPVPGGQLPAGDGQPPAAGPIQSTAFDPNAIDANATTAFRQLVTQFTPPHAELAGLKSVLVAQWALETDWGRSALAGQHFNFAGIPWLEQLSDIAAKVPHPVTPERGDFCRFLSLDTFATGYGHRLERDPALAGWRAQAGTPDAFMRFLADKWRPSDPAYLSKLSGIFARMARKPLVTGPAAATQPGSGGAPATADGFVLRVERIRSERRRGAAYDRTVSRYQAFFDGQPIAELSGMMFERQGPGDNTRTGVARHRRIRQGVYPLLTHAGSARIGGVTKFKTHGFTSNDGVREPPMPSLRLGNTGARGGILLHPGNDYVWSIGCLNPQNRPKARTRGWFLLTAVPE